MPDFFSGKRISGGLRPLALSLLWILCIILVNPVGDFPLNDDWAYGRNVQNLVEQGRLYFEDWLAMTLVAQVLWGAVFCWIFGFSFTVLRFSTLLMGLAGIWACYYCFKEITKDAKLAFFCSLLILFNPWFFSLSFSFMTDVPFFSTFMLSQLFFLKALRTQHRKDIIPATFFALFSTLIRQWGLLGPLVFGLVYVLKNRDRRSILVGFLPLLLTFIAMMGFIEWLDQTQGVSEHYGRPGLLFDRFLQAELWSNFWQRTGIFLFYWGLLLFPLNLLLIFFKNNIRSGWSILASCLSAGLVFLLAQGAWDAIPAGNVLYNFGLGPKLLKDGYYGINTYPGLNDFSWIFIKIMGFTGAWLLLWLVWVRLASFQKSIREWNAYHWNKVVALLTVLFFTGYLLVDYYYWDRYYLLLLPFWAFLILPEKKIILKKQTWGLGIVFLLPIALFSLSATHDFLSWNRARWRALNMLTEEEHVPPNQIDGGFEFNAFFQTGPRRPVSRFGKSWWFVGEDRYVVSFGQMDCYEKKASIPYYRWLPPGKDSLWILERPLLEQVDTIGCNAEFRTKDGQHFFSDSGAFLLANGPQQDSTHAFSGRYSIKLSAEQPYGFTLKIPNIQPCERLSVSVWRFAESGHPRAGIVMASPDNQLFYDFQQEPVQESMNGWQLLQHEISVPAGYVAENFIIYIWNANPEESVWIDDIQIIRKKKARDEHELK